MALLNNMRHISWRWLLLSSRWRQVWSLKTPVRYIKICNNSQNITQAWCANICHYKIMHKKRKHIRSEIHFFNFLYSHFILLLRFEKCKKISTFRTGNFCKLNIFKQRISRPVPGLTFWACYQICQKNEKKIKPWRIEGGKKPTGYTERKRVIE